MALKEPGSLALRHLSGDGTGDGGFWIPTSSSARCGVGLGEVALPGAAARGSPRRALVQIPKRSQEASGPKECFLQTRSLRLTDLLALNKGLARSFCCEVFPNSHFRPFFFFYEKINGLPKGLSEESLSQRSTALWM